MMLGVTMGASASFLTPFANGVSLMVHGTAAPQGRQRPRHRQDGAGAVN